MGKCKSLNSTKNLKYMLYLYNRHLPRFSKLNYLIIND